jgi:hypothetical protein
MYRLLLGVYGGKVHMHKPMRAKIERCRKVERANLCELA